MNALAAKERLYLRFGNWYCRSRQVEYESEEDAGSTSEYGYPLGTILGRRLSGLIEGVPVALGKTEADLQRMEKKKKRRV